VCRVVAGGRVIVVTAIAVLCELFVIKLNVLRSITVIWLANIERMDFINIWSYLTLVVTVLMYLTGL